MKCPECKSDNPPHMYECSSCGTSLISSEENGSYLDERDWSLPIGAIVGAMPGVGMFILGAFVANDSDGGWGAHYALDK